MESENPNPQTEIDQLIKQAGNVEINFMAIFAKLVPAFTIKDKIREKRSQIAKIQQNTRLIDFEKQFWIQEFEDDLKKLRPGKEQFEKAIRETEILSLLRLLRQEHGMQVPLSKIVIPKSQNKAVVETIAKEIAIYATNQVTNEKTKMDIYLQLITMLCEQLTGK